MGHKGGGHGPATFLAGATKLKQFLSEEKKTKPGAHEGWLEFFAGA